MTDNEASERRDALLLKMAALPPMTQAEFKAKLAAEKAAKKGREPKPAPTKRPD